jgi:hypothetical protein
MGSFSAMARNSYALPHYAIYSTQLLRTFACQKQIGVFASGRAPGEEHSVAFANAITNVGTVTADDLAGRSPQKLLFYARPDMNNSRNMYSLGILGLKAAIRAGYFKGSWEFYGIGTVDEVAPIDLADGRIMRPLRRQDPARYREILRSHDLGISLMHSPHPSLVPLEMASAGMPAVTNTYATKSKPRLQAISSNLIPVPPTIEGIQAGLKEAVEKVPDVHERARGARVNWSTSWECSFTEPILQRISEFIELASQARTNERNSSNGVHDQETRRTRRRPGRIANGTNGHAL